MKFYKGIKSDYTIYRCSQNNEILRRKLTKHIQYLCAENYWTQLNEIREEVKKWRAIHVHRLEDSVKSVILQTLICRYNAIPIKIWTRFFVNIDKLTLKFIWIPYICVCIQYLFFSFWLTSLCMTVSRSIHLTTNNSISFLFMAE